MNPIGNLKATRIEIHMIVFLEFRKSFEISKGIDKDF